MADTLTTNWTHFNGVDTEQLAILGVPITVSAAQINALGSGGIVGLTATAAELNALHGSGVVEADIAKLHALLAIVPSAAAEAAAIGALNTGTATTAQIATAVNSIITALTTFGILA